ncbi:elongation factor Ts [Candidatus Campbellbacteria bacterium CG11_big_fil_rev_8_21_14_0_20_44_21]|uniref:Elongation factor Ts n=1 Tax=Candidatus Campbellbacteria bacterium CG22_combo_CG10-13_8_21_14_all_43_18 TaxID=1974530 RepID=A0A2H0DWT1_9BACT|nr:MAG: elongation factor Ts [Candidatus Campbellbacteria bacterium CG22_combo_CG10-13_8_21_14_all_43_18]PIR24526.1 MAG: elongation factor Ts [Candidatus Campbellbacteria bacterium CG11_big_fil_rev_8_21_14_0_20_44_21]
MITTDQVKELRARTGISIMQCKKALEEAKGDIEKAEILLRKKSKEVAAKKAERSLSSGVVASYVHGNGRVGSLIELLCETDFVAKNEEFQSLARDLAMQVAACDTEFLTRDEINDEDEKKVKEVIEEEIKDKPEEMKEKIRQGKLDAYFKDRILLEQSFIKNSDKKISDLVQEAAQKFGERIEIGRFAKFTI